MILRNKGYAIIGIFVRMLPAIVGRTTPQTVEQIRLFVATVSSIASHQGVPGLVKYLKTCSVHTQQSIAGHKSVQALRVSLTGSGLPRCLPVDIRNKIRGGDSSSMKLALTMLSLYRDFVYPSKINLKSIISNYTGDKYIISELKAFIPKFVKLFIIAKTKVSLRESLIGKFSYFPISKSSPQATFSYISTYPLTMIRSALAMDQTLVEALRTLSSLMKRGFSKDPLTWIDSIRSHSESLGITLKHGYTGKLGLKQEAAGKMRVFAMVDPWSQMILRPFHMSLFKILSKHPMDGTFDQLRPLRRIQGIKVPLYSMDLSSATDRLPMILQVFLFQEIFNLSQVEVNAWRTVLTGREYLVPPKKGEVLPKAVTYSVGQPMGALSSWAMLAITHHFIVQVAAWMTYPDMQTLFKGYAVLGDDIVIFNSNVAKQYHKIITRMGVECNLSKSVLSPEGLGLEFAKRTFYKGINVSPIPFKEFSTALESPAALVEFGKIHSLTFAQMVKCAGFGYKVLGSLTKPIHKLNIKIKYLVMTLAMSEEDVKKSFKMLIPYLSSTLFNRVLETYLSLEINKYWKEYRTLIMKLGNHSIYDILIDLPKNQRKIFSGIYWDIHQPYLVKVGTLYRDLMDSLMSLKVNNPTAFVKLLNSFLVIRRKAAAWNMSSLSHQRSSLIKRFSSPKLFRLHQSFMTVCKGVQKLELSHTATPLKSTHNLEAGFLIPSTILRRLPHLIKPILRRPMVRAFLWNRIKWMAGYSIFASVSTYFYGVPATVAFLVAIWTTVTSFFGLEGTSSTDSRSLFGYLGLIILHTLEIYLVAALLTAGYHYQLCLDWLALMSQGYFLGDFTLWYVIMDGLAFINRLTIDTAAGLVPTTVQAVYDSISQAPPLGKFFLVMPMSYILIWIIRWFFGF